MQKTKLEWFKEFKILIKSIKNYKNREEALTFLDKQISLIEFEQKRAKLRREQITNAKDDVPMRIVLSSIDQYWRTLDEIYEIVKQDIRFNKQTISIHTIINRLNKLVQNKLAYKENFRENDSPNAKIRVYYKKRE